MDVQGKIINSDIAVTHKKIRHAVDRTVSIYENKIARGDVFTPRDYFYYGNELREKTKAYCTTGNYLRGI